MPNGSIPRYNIWYPITPSDTVNFDRVTQSGGISECCDAIWVGGAGIAQCVMQNDTVVAFTCVAGSLLPIAAKRVNAGSTTATLMVALYEE
jgi:hypothetical protein